MKHCLLPENGTFYKANMHSHSILSDGKLTVEKLKEEYVKRGYSILAYTDHDKFYTHNELTDENFLAINGYEVDISNWDTDDSHYVRCYHFNCYALTNQDNSEILPLPAYKDKKGINHFIQRLRDSGFIVCYNHPHWSLQTLDDYRDLEGLFGMEIFNSGAYMGSGIPDNETNVYDTMLRLGKRLYCLASDDNHNGTPMGHPESESFGGFIMVKATSLDYNTIMQAIQNGDFYASTGPLIEELTVENLTVTIKCSPVVRIAMTTAGRRGSSVNTLEGETISFAEFTVDPKDTFIRFELVDERGRRANSRAYFLDEFMD